MKRPLRTAARCVRCGYTEPIHDQPMMVEPRACSAYGAKFTPRAPWWLRILNRVLRSAP